ncbi:hypothetical protein CerSpe_208970 [Prunus speciosa]
MTSLKNTGVISFASIAPFDDDQVQSHYLGHHSGSVHRLFQDAKLQPITMVGRSWQALSVMGVVDCPLRMVFSLPVTGSRVSKNFMESLFVLQMTPRKSVSAMKSNHKLS